MVADLGAGHLTGDGNDNIYCLVCHKIDCRHRRRSPDYSRRRSRSRSPKRRPPRRHTPTPEKSPEKLVNYFITICINVKADQL